MVLLAKMSSNLCIFKIFVLAIFLPISESTGNVYVQDQKQQSYEIAPKSTYAPFWDDFRVTWGPNTSHPHFNRMPRTAEEAEKHGWYRTSKNCYNDGRFLGFRYAEPKGYSSALSLLFDINGIICGIQMSIPLECAEAMGNPYQYSQVPMFLPTNIKGVKHLTLTAYFVAPAKICTKGRNEKELRSEGTGTGLWFQDGRRTIPIPKTLEDARYFGWDKVQCFPNMGYHSFYRLDLWDRMRCSRVWPFVLLANKQDQIHGFVFMVIANCQSKRFEHLPMDALKKLINGDAVKEMPKCAVEELSRFNLTTMHVYFRNPQTIDC